MYIKMSKVSSSDDIEQFFTVSEFKELSEYEKLRLRNIKENYEMMIEIGLNVPKPEFMCGPFRKRKPKYVDSSDSDEEWKPGGTEKYQRKTAPSACRKTFKVPVKKKAKSDQPKESFRSGPSLSAPQQREGEDTFDYLGRVTINEDGDLVPAEEDAESANKRPKIPQKKKATKPGHSNVMTHRYPQRAGSKKCYKDLDGPNDDCFVYCEDCHELYEHDCPEHPLTVIENTPVPKGCRDQARRSLPDGLVVKEASIKDAGLGVWAEKFFPKGVRFGPYGGEIVGEDAGRDSGYAWEIFDRAGKSNYVDGKSLSKGNWMRYVNCACSETDQNLVAYQYRDQIYYRSFKPIHPGQELLVFYGEEYAVELGIVVNRTNNTKTSFNAERHPCPKCSKIFTDYKFLARHLRQSHQSSTEWYNYLKSQKIKVSSFNINACNIKIASQVKKPFKGINRTFKKSKCLNRSEQNVCKKIVNIEGQYTCHLCGVVFLTNALLTTHRHVMHDYQNEDSAKRETARSSVSSHSHRGSGENHRDVEKCMKINNRGKRHAGSECDEIISGGNIKVGKVFKGEKQRLDKTTYACSHCDKAFTQSGHLKGHMRTHTGERPYACSHCDKAFTQSGHLKGHMRTHTGERPYACSHCDKTFALSGDLKAHMRTHTGKRPYACSHCDKTFALSGHLKRHMRTHTGERPYACSHCDKAFTQSGHLKGHMRTHTGERPYACSHCDKTFARSDLLKAHMRTHTGERPYACSHCDKTFALSGDLKIHMRTHTGERPYACSHCSKTFALSGHLKGHMRTHTGERPYACSHCDETFRWTNVWKIHMRTHTAE